MNVNFINKIEKILATITPVSLDDISEVKLMRRTDTKYVVNAERIPAILQKLYHNYKVLHINNMPLQPYETTYFDTEQYSMYHAHHNQRRNRYKIRKRTYVSSGDKYLEVKFKNNKGETLKTRQQNHHSISCIDATDHAFLPQHSPYVGHELSPTLNNHFQRITLVNNAKTERITIDLNLEFSVPNKASKASFSHLVIIEVKRDRDSQHSEIVQVLRDERIQAGGFSKYCMGLAVLNQDVKYQLFKPRLRTYHLWNIKHTINNN